MVNIIDSHVHLFPASEIHDLAWQTPSHPLSSQHSMDEYRQATSSSTRLPSDEASSAEDKEAGGGGKDTLSGFVFIETDRGSNAASEAWSGPLREISFLKRVITGAALPGEGHSPADSPLCLGVIPWAPLPDGPAAMQEYVDKAREEAGGEAWERVKGFRYLLQDKPHGTMLEEGFVESLRWMGKRGYVFEVGVDQHRRGRRQVEEVLEMIGRAHEGVEEGEKVTFILNHLLKPDLSVYNPTDPSFLSWRSSIFSLERCSKTYIKISGSFSEFSPSQLLQLRNAPDPASHVFQSLFAWLAVVLATFGPERCMFASDWPVCTVGVDDAWATWKAVVGKMCWMASMGEEDRRMIFEGTARRAYNL